MLPPNQPTSACCSDTALNSVCVAAPPDGGPGCLPNGTMLVPPQTAVDCCSGTELSNECAPANPCNACVYYPYGMGPYPKACPPGESYGICPSTCSLGTFFCVP
jgi:hypothetical protein